MAMKFYVGLELECDVEGCNQAGTTVAGSRQACIDDAMEDGWLIAKRVKCAEHNEASDES